MGWLFSPQFIGFDKLLVRDLLKFPELLFLGRYYYVIHVSYALLLFGLGEFLARSVPSANTSGAQLVVWGSIVSTVCVCHMVWSANSFCHRFGARRFETDDHSRNNMAVALLTLGDGWHNNHHRFPQSARHGIAWWEIDVNYLVLRLLATLGIVWDLKVPRWPV